MKTILFTDLDDTLFISARKQPPKPDYTLVTTLADGQPSAYQSPKQQQFWQLWQQNAVCIPVTARNLDAFQRVNLPFTHHAIINHGGTILDADGNIDEDWHQQQVLQAKSSAKWLQKQYDTLQALAEQQQMDIRLRINQDCGLDLYVLLKSNTQDETAVATLAQQWQQQYQDGKDGYLHCNGNNLAILPYWLGKAQAVQWLQNKLKSQYGHILSIGCGDSDSDLAFMQQCDYWITPSGGQIDKRFAH